MLCRTGCTFFLTLSLLGVVSGCNNKPKIVMPTEKAPPAPRPHVAGGGAAPAKPAPDGEPQEKLRNPKELPADATPPEDKE
jgi:hypothetical protein